jgi:hypothetical protein
MHGALLADHGHCVQVPKIPLGVTHAWWQLSSLIRERRAQPWDGPGAAPAASCGEDLCPPPASLLALQQGVTVSSGCVAAVSEWSCMQFGHCASTLFVVPAGPARRWV